MERQGEGEGEGEVEEEEEVYSECVATFLPIPPAASVSVAASVSLRPRSPYSKDLLRRRSAVKRQAPQPPSRPLPAPTPAPAPALALTPTPPTPSPAPSPPPPASPTEITLTHATTHSPDTTPTLTPTLSRTPTPTPAVAAPPVTTVQMVLQHDLPTGLLSRPAAPPSPCPITPSPVKLGPITPPRSLSSLEATRNLRIRLIDDESDSESHMSDSFDEHTVFPRVPVPSPPPTVSIHLPPRPHPASSPASATAPATMLPLAPRPSRVGEDGVVSRGKARRLFHSASDPGLTRPPLRPHHHHHQPRPPALDLVSEEEGDEDVGEGRVGVGAGVGRGGLQRSDSNVTVATLQEELMVAPRLKLRVTLTNITCLVLVAALAAPHTSTILYTAFRLVFGTLFPAYYSYKAVKTKNVKEYVKWMMYWIVFAFFTCFETLTDLFISFWFPFYYELKILVVLWLLSPATRGSSILYRKFVHPWLARREEDIDQCIAQARQQGYSTVVQLGTKGVNYATTVLMQTAIKGGGGLMNQLRRSYSQGELVGDDGDMNRNVKALPPHYPQHDHYASDYSLDHHNLPPGQYELERRSRAESDAAYKPRGSSASRGVRSTKTRSADVSEVYYQDVPDDGSLRRRSPRTHDPASRVLSADDLTSGYSSGDPDPADLTSTEDTKVRPRPDPQDTFSPMPEEVPRALGKVRRTQSLSASTLSLHRTSRRGGGEAGRPGLRSGRGSGAADDPGAPHASYSGQGQPSGHHAAGFRRSRPGEVSAYATLPRAAGKRTTAAAAAKKRQV